MSNRHLSRSIVLQSLFEWDFGGCDNNTIDEILERNEEEFAPGLEDFSFIKNLTTNILLKYKELDIIISKAAPEWPIDKISIIDRNVLRIGLYELLFSIRQDVPAKVAINEAIELAKTFGGDHSGKFVNGVLGSVYKEIGEPGKDETGEHNKSKNKNSIKHSIDNSKLPVEHLGGAIIYARNGEEIYLALVHDIFGHWTLSKGHLKKDEDLIAGTAREIKEEIGLDVTIKEKLGENEYLSSNRGNPKQGKIRKQVTYFLAEAEYKELQLEDEKGGLDDAKWFKLSEIVDLNIYDDILPIFTQAINRLIEKPVNNNNTDDNQ
ncbi:transcription antitermination factor NusB [Patescibacteria group bacterium]|nr:transcription antitermination factor NusB [Patescibacteria group bacterium]MBU1730057.1 transcription antitermination factor NusB [Patescibacteria group bacterium]MBU1956635.1 transcription antitermination factor NusB [Patescibacteria group bacterium]